MRKYGRLAFALLLLMCLSVSPALAAGTLTLPAKTESIGDEAFYGSTAVTGVVLPEGVKTIGSRAFAHSALKTVNLPASLTFIADDAFDGCQALQISAQEGTYAYDWAVGAGLIVPGSSALAAPVASALTVESSGRIRVMWTAVEGAVSYRVLRSESENGVYTRILTTDSTAFNNTSAQVGDTYYYVVVAISADGTESPRSNVVSCTCAMPRPVISLSNVESTGKIRIDWDAVDGASAYEICRSLDGESWNALGTTQALYWVDETAQAGVQYYYRVKALAENAAVNSAYSAAKYRTCDLPQPSIASVETVEGSGKIRVSWNAMEGAVSYNLLRSDSEDGNYILMGNTQGTSYTNTSAEAGVMYYYRLVALAENEDAKSARSQAVSCLCVLPRPVISLSNVESTGKIHIDWDAVDGASAYEICRSLDGESWSALGTTQALYWVDETAQAGVQYDYRVKALAENAAVNSAYSAAKYRTCDLGQPVLTLTQTQEGTIQLSWSAVEDAAEYKVYRSTAYDGEYKWIKITTDTSHTDYAAAVGVTYYYKILACAQDSSANSAYSAICSAVCPKMIVHAELNDAGKPLLRWNAVEGAASYGIHRALSPDGPFTRLYDSTGTSSANGSAASGITYYYRICAYDAQDNLLLESNNTVSITVAPPENETLETLYVKRPRINLYNLPDADSGYTHIPYMAPVQRGAAVSSNASGTWYRVFYKNDLYYVWSAVDSDQFASERSSFVYTSDNPYRQEVVDLASYIALNWRTVYEHDASMGVQKEDGTYAFDCSGFVRYVMNTVMQKYVPTYKVVAEIWDLVVTENIYNAGYPGEFSAYEVPRGEMQPGDVVFFSQESENDHCGIYLGNGEFVHSSHYEYLEDSVYIMPLAEWFDEQVSVVRCYLPDEVQAAQTERYVITNNCKLYAQRNTESEQLHVFKTGETVTVLFTNSDNWAYVRLADGTTGYILLRNLSETNPL